MTMSRTWTYGVYGCFDDCSVCIAVFLCPAYVFGKNAEAVGENCCLCALSQHVPGLNLYTRAYIRSKIRELKQINGTFKEDLNAHCSWVCCYGILLVIQETRELKIPGGQNMARE